MSAVEQIKKLIERDEAEYFKVLDKMKMEGGKFDDGILGRDASFLAGRISGLSLALMAIEGSK